MRILHVMPSMDPIFGGPVAAVHVMARGLLDAGESVDIVTVHPRARSAAAFDASLEGVKWRSFPIQLAGYGVSIPLWRWLRAHLHEYDLVHIHGVFSFASFIAQRTALRAAVPYVVRPFGVLNRWGMERRKAWLKHLLFKWLEKPVLDRADALHFTSDDEAADVARLEIKAPAFVIPLGLDLSPYQQLPPASLFEDQFPNFKADQTILFLSRIDVKKGLDLLLPAFKSVLSKTNGVKLIVAGDGDQSLLSDLKREAEELGIADHILWTGFLSGEVRLAAMAAATVFCLPSRSENFGMALLEAMAAGLPCVATDQVALCAEAAKADAVSMTPVEAAPVAHALHALLTNENLRRDLSEKAREYAVRHHSMAAVAGRLMKMYELLCASRPQSRSLK